MEVINLMCNNCKKNRALMRLYVQGISMDLCSRQCGHLYVEADFQRQLNDGGKEIEQSNAIPFVRKEKI